MTNIWGERYTEKRPTFDIFDGLGLLIQADTFGQYFMGTIRFNEFTISSNDCTKKGPLGEAYTFVNDDTNVTMTVQCAKPKNTKKYGNDWHLDLDLIVSSMNQMHDIEAYGVCMDPHSDDGFDPVLEPPKRPKASKPTCNCIGSCSFTGDPHLDSFAGKRTLLREPVVNMYSVGGFTITGQLTDSHYYIKHIDINGEQQYDLDSCKDLRMGSSRNEVKLGSFDKAVGSTGRVWGVINCAIETKGKRKGTKFLNMYLNRNKLGASESFLELEAASGSTGACTLGNPFIRSPPPLS